MPLPTSSGQPEGHGGGTPLYLIDVARRIATEHEHVTVADVNNHRVILAVNEVPYPWHVHEKSDEWFLVIDGALRIHFENGTSVLLNVMDSFLVPAGTAHRTSPEGRCVNIVVELADAGTRFIDRSD